MCPPREGICLHGLPSELTPVAWCLYTGVVQDRARVQHDKAVNQMTALEERVRSMEAFVQAMPAWREDLVGATHTCQTAPTSMMCLA